MAQLKPNSSHHDDIPSTPGKFKMEKTSYIHRLRWQTLLVKFSWAVFVVGLLMYLLFFHSMPPSNASHRRQLVHSWGGQEWERRVQLSTRSRTGNVILVTGAAGFIASPVCEALKHRGDGVLGLDNFNDYYSRGLKVDRYNAHKNGYFIVEGDLNNTELLQKLFGEVKFTHVMHYAAQAGVRYAMKNPSSYIASNIAGFVNLLEVCKNANPQPAIIWASSSSVYGLNTKVPFSERDRTDQPASLYAATKKAGEEIAHTYNHIHGLSITGLRFFTVYGPWGRPDMAYFSFTKNILEGKPIHIYEGPNHGTVARDFTYIDDIVQGCIAALDTAEKSTGSGGKKKGPAQFRIYNLGNTSPVPVTKLVSILEKLLKKKAVKVMLTMPRNGDVQFTHANITLAQREIGYKPTTDLQTGLKKFVRWYQSYYSRKKSSE